MSIGSLGSSYYFRQGKASVDKQQASASLNLQKLDSSVLSRIDWKDKDTLELSDGAMVHFADKIAGPDGVGKGDKYQRIVSFLKKSLEGVLGGSVGEISVDELEVDASTKSLKTKSATPKELGADQGFSYNSSSKDINIDEKHIVVRGVVSTSDGKEQAYELKIDIASAVGSQSNVKHMAFGDAASESKVLMFDGVASELHNVRFKFDSDPTSGLLAGTGKFTIRDEEHSKVDTGFRRYEWCA